MAKYSAFLTAIPRVSIGLMLTSPAGSLGIDMGTMILGWTSMPNVFGSGCQGKPCIELTSSRFHQETEDPTLWPQEVALCTLEELSISQATTISLKTSHSKTSTCKKDTETDKLTDS